jgi:5-methylcytosine-specific restriction endonuclease McrA
MSLRSRNSKQRKSLLRTLRERDGDLCHICYRPMSFKVPNQPESATFDHIIPKAVGGRDRMDNLKLAHNKCNKARGFLTQRLLPHWTLKQLPSPSAVPPDPNR